MYVCVKVRKYYGTYRKDRLCLTRLPRLPLLLAKRLVNVRAIGCLYVQYGEWEGYVSYVTVCYVCDGVG